MDKELQELLISIFLIITIIMGVVGVFLLAGMMLASAWVVGLIFAISYAFERSNGKT